MNEQLVISHYRERLLRLVKACDGLEASRKALNDHMSGHDERGELQDTAIDDCLRPLLRADDDIVRELDNALDAAREFLGRD